MAEHPSQVKPPLITHDPAAGFGGVVSASNAASDPQATDPRTGMARGAGADALQLLWFIPEAARRVRRTPEWKRIIDALPPAKFDPDVDDPSLEADASELEDRRAIFEVIARGIPGGRESVDDALIDEARRDARFAPRLLLLRGEAQFELDEVEVLKAEVASSAPFAANDEPLQRCLDHVARFLAAPGLVVSPGVVLAMRTMLRDAFKRVPRPVPATDLETQSERALVARRAYQKRVVFGEPHVRGLFFIGATTMGVPAYFPASMSDKLPAFRQARLRLLCEAHFQADQYEAYPAALRVAAVARIVR